MQRGKSPLTQAYMTLYPGMYVGKGGLGQWQVFGPPLTNCLCPHLIDVFYESYESFDINFILKHILIK